MAIKNDACVRLISEIESFSETNGADGRAEGFGDFIDTPMCQAVNAPDRR